jgi:hypothetical protein
MPKEQQNIQYNPKQAFIGMDLNSIPSQVREGMVVYALNAVVEGFSGEQTVYQNEQANEFCAELPSGYRVLGQKNIIEDGIILFWLINPNTGASEIGQIINCTYSKLINDICLGFDIDHPILKIVYKKTDCGETEVYWVDALNRVRYINLSKLPYKIIKGDNTCDDIITTDIDCNKLNVQPDFLVPEINVVQVDGNGDIIAGVYQFAVQYSDSSGVGYTSYYSVTNPVSIFDPAKITLDFNYNVGKSIELEISNLDITGLYEHLNVAIIKTINNTTSVELLGTFDITNNSIKVVYSGESKTDIKLSTEDIFAKYDFYSSAGDITVAQDTLILSQLTTNQRVSYQEIANQIKLQWQSWRIPKDSYKDPLISANLRGYMGDEVYPFEFVPILKNGVQLDGFHIPGRPSISSDLEIINNNDVIDTGVSECEIPTSTSPRWKVYNTATVLGYEKVYTDFLAGISSDCDGPVYKGGSICNIDPTKPECYTGPFQYGDFAYWESTDLYPCNDIYGHLQNTPIRHHKFPDSVIIHIHDNSGFIYPKGIKINIGQIVSLIKNSSLSQEDKDNIQGFKIVRGNRANSKSVVAKGLLYNVGKYIKENKSWYYPNYPFNDLRADPFITTESNYVPSSNTITTGNPSCFQYLISTSDITATVQYTDCSTQNVMFANLAINNSIAICSIQTPVFTVGTGNIQIDQLCAENEDPDVIVVQKEALKGFETDDSKKRYTFHSPDTTFFQPNLGNILKLETAEFGEADSHFVEVKNHAKYKFISQESVISSLIVAVGIGFSSATVGVSTNLFNGTAAYTALQVMLSLIEKLIPAKNFAYQQNTLGEYTSFLPILNIGNKQRKSILSVYLQSGVANIGDEHSVNNYQRESSVYIKTAKTLPFVSNIPGVPTDTTRYTLSEAGLCNSPATELKRDISAYYGAIKRNIKNQYGQLYSYQTIDTGFQVSIDLAKDYTDNLYSIFGGDIFINRMALKKKYPFFIDNRVSPNGTNRFADGADILYNELGNIGYPKYWFSTDVRRTNTFFSLFGVKETAFDCNGSKFFYDSGKIYLFSYGVPYFYCESEVNVDLRQAFNDKEGDFYPRVQSGIPDDWMQEANVSINNDNTYYYNKTYSKQNKENLFTHLPLDWDPSDECNKVYPFRAVFSEDSKIFKGKANNWRLFKPSAKFDFPQNYGKLISIDGIENKQVLVRFEQKPLLYNALLTAPTSAADLYLRQTLFSQQVPPLDYADTDLGWMGTQHKFFLKTQHGDVTVDAAGGMVFLINGTSYKDLTEDTETQQVSKWMMEFLPFQIAKINPNIDNHYKGIGLTGVHDTKYDRLILTKLDYKPLFSDITYNNGRYYRGSTEVQLTNPDYFRNYSFTISYDFTNQSWVSFHSYIPNYYIGDNNIFYTGLNGLTSSLWRHNTSVTKFNNFYNTIYPYILETSYSRAFYDEILQNIKDYSRIFKYTDWQEFVETDDDYFNKMIIYSNQQCSGVLNLTPKPKNNLKEYGKYPIYNTDSKTITFTKSGSFYQINTFWDMVVNTKTTIWNKSNVNLSVFKELNQTNMDYGKRSRKKAPIRSKELKIRYILDNKDNIKIISSFSIAPTQISYK